MYRTFAKKKTDNKLRQNASQFFAIMEKNGQAASERVRTLDCDDSDDSGEERQEV